MEEDDCFEDKIRHLNSGSENSSLNISKSIKDEEIKEMISTEEKEVKRKVSSQIFNKLNAGIDYCDDNFDFKFD